MKELAGDLRPGTQSLGESGSGFCLSATASPSREPWDGIETNTSSSWIPRARQDTGDLSPTSSPVLTSSGYSKRMGGRVALQTDGSVCLPAWLFIQDQGSFLSLTIDLDRNSTQGVPADIIEPERLGLEEGVKHLPVSASQVLR